MSIRGNRVSADGRLKVRLASGGLVCRSERQRAAPTAWASASLLTACVRNGVCRLGTGSSRPRRSAGA